VSGALSPFLTVPAILVLPVARYVEGWPERIAFFGLMVATGVVLPFLAIFLAVRQRRVSDVHLADLASRPRYVALCFAFVLAGLVGLVLVRAPKPVTVYFGCYALAMAAGGSISVAYKISGHCMALGGILAGLLFEAPAWAPVAAVALLLVAWARVRRGRHTVLQCLMGGLVGFVCVAGGVALGARVFGY
jgi:membrane-associated phospholipid phosphatase